MDNRLKEYTNGMHQKSDEQLIIAYSRGDEAAIETLIARHLDATYTFVSRYVWTAGDAEDITQDVFLRAWKNLKKFDRTKSFKTWLFAIAKNASLNWIKKKKPSLFSEFSVKNAHGETEGGEAFFADTRMDQSPLPDELFARADRTLQLVGAIEKLPQAQRTVLELRHYDEYSFREIGESLGEPLNTVKSRYRRALAALKKLVVL